MRCQHDRRAKYPPTSAVSECHLGGGHGTKVLLARLETEPELPWRITVSLRSWALHLNRREAHMRRIIVIFVFAFGLIQTDAAIAQKTAHQLPESVALPANFEIDYLLAAKQRANLPPATSKFRRSGSVSRRSVPHFNRDADDVVVRCALSLELPSTE